MRLLAAALLLRAMRPSVRADSQLAAEVRASAKRYHEDPARIDTMRARLTQAAKTDPEPDTLIALAQVCFISGDIRARTPAEKLEAYEQGREAARRAVELAPRSVTAHFWYGTNTARWGQARGVMQSLFLIPTVKQ